MTTSVMDTFGITVLPGQSVPAAPAGAAAGTGLMNPREYEDLLKKLRHLRVQTQSTEKTLVELRIQTATLIREHIDRADHGQKQGSKYPPAKPGALVLLAPQRGKTGLRLKADITSQTSVDRNEHLPSLGF